MNDFFRTPMGQRYYEHTIPLLARNVGRVADLLERLVSRLEQATPKPEPVEPRGSE